MQHQPDKSRNDEEYHQYLKSSETRRSTMDHVPEKDDYGQSEKTKRDQLPLVLEMLEQKKIGARANRAHEEYAQERSATRWDCSLLQLNSFSLLGHDFNTP
jgi:hypothetical protein